MKKILGVALGILSAIGGFVDIGDFVVNGVVGSRFGLSLVWVVLLGVVGICLFAQMAGRVAAVSGQAAFQIIRERLGPRAALANLAASFLVNLLTVAAEVGGIALALELASSVNYLLWIPLAALAVWLVIWRVKFKIMENVTSLLGLCLVVFAIAFFMLHPQWPELGRQAALQVVPSGDETASYWYYAVGLFGSSVSPYEVFFFSSGAMEEHWSAKDLSESRLNVLVGFPLGGLLSISIAACTAVVLLPAGIHVEALSQVVLPLAEAGGKIALAVGIIGVVAAVFGAALETTLSSGYMLAQFFGWPWGKFRSPERASQFHVTMIVALLLAAGVLFTGVDPIKLTEASVVFSAVALPLTYVPILIIANDPQYLGEHVNGKFLNAVAILFLVIIVVAAIAAIPLMIVSGAGS